MWERESKKTGKGMEKSRSKERESLLWGENENSSLWLEKGRRELQRQEKKR